MECKNNDVKAHGCRTSSGYCLCDTKRDYHAPMYGNVVTITLGHTQSTT